MEYGTFIVNYSGRGAAPLSKFERFLSSIRDGNLELAQTLYEENKFDLNNCSTDMPASGQAAIHIATKEGHIDCVKFLLDKKANVNLAERRKKTALHIAASAGHLDIIQLLIQYNAYLDVIDKFGRTPLNWAVSIGRVDIVRELLDAGASVTFGQGNWHPLHDACKRGFLEIAQILIKAGSPVNNPSKYKGCTPFSPLHIAAREGHLNCVNMLIDAGADVHCKNAGGHTPLHEASHSGYNDVVLRLLRHNANPNSVNNQKRTPLHEACSEGKVPCAVVLLDAGSKPNSKDMICDTPLHLALRARHPPPIAISLMTILLQYGASPSIEGSSDETAFDIIKDTGQSLCLEDLMDALENPLSLMQMCKVTIRKKLKFMSDLERVDMLPLPLSVKKYLREDIVTEEDVRGE